MDQPVGTYRLAYCVVHCRCFDLRVARAMDGGLDVHPSSSHL